MGRPDLQTYALLSALAVVELGLRATLVLLRVHLNLNQ